MSADTSMSRPKYVAYEGRPAMSLSRDASSSTSAIWRAIQRARVRSPALTADSDHCRKSAVKMSSRVSGVSARPVVVSSASYSART